MVMIAFCHEHIIIVLLLDKCERLQALYLCDSELLVIFLCVCARARAFNLVKGHQKATFKLKRVSADTRGSIVANRHDFTPQYDSSVN